MQTCTAQITSRTKGKVSAIAMKAYRIILISALLVCIVTIGTANTLHVALDGSQPYTVIQEAINASADTDTVLVYPGRYYENIRFYGKNIILASLELTTGNLDNKYNTILDGNQNGSVIQIRNGETNATIRGFTITNGSGFYYDLDHETYGGGILIGALNPINNIYIVNCAVELNQAGTGGGIQADRCNLFLSGTTIKHNVASIGGGLKASSSYTTQYSTIFDPVNRCNIFSNKAAVGSDLYYNQQNNVRVIVDTFTVVNPSNFYAAAIPANSNLQNPYTFDILHSIHQEINHDLFVAPWGDDANDGMSECTPLKTIFQAVYNIASDPVNPKTIHLAEGIYAKSLNHQLFPIPMKSWTKLMGASTIGVVLDAELQSAGISISPFSNDFQIQFITIINCQSGIKVSQSSDIIIKDVVIDKVRGIQFATGYYGYENSDQTLSNVVINDINSQWMTNGVTLHQRSGIARLNNIEISNVMAAEKSTACVITAMGISSVHLSGCSFHANRDSSVDHNYGIMYVSPFDNYCQKLSIDVSSSSFYDNQQSVSNSMAYIHALNDTAFISNCTFAGNTGGSTALMVKGDAVLENNVFWNPQLSTEITAYYSASEGISGSLEFVNNCIRNGQNGIYNMSTLNEIIWHESNIAIDPLFQLQGNHPYRLSSTSPLIDAGMQAAFMEPGIDAGGNERFWDGDGDGLAVIDIGAYEYQPIFSPNNLSAQLWQQQIILTWEMPAVDRSLSGYRIYRNNLPYAESNDPSLLLFRDYSPVNDTLSYYVVALYGSVESFASNSVTVIVEGVDNSDEVLIPAALNLSISPNPFSDIAVIKYNLSHASLVKMQIYNLKGQLVKTIINASQSKGEQLAMWEGCDDTGRHLASGIYFLRLSIDGKAEKPHRLVLLR